jgi:hypothetical protein
MHPGSNYKALWNGSPVEFTVVHDSLLQVQLPAEVSSGELSILQA